MRNRAIVLLAALTCLFAVAATQPSCVNPETELQRARQVDGDLATREAALKAAREKPETTPAQKAEIDGLLAAIRQDRATIKDKIDQLDHARAAAASDDPLVRIIGGIAGIIPAPFGGLVTLGLPVIGLGLKLWRTNSAATSIARSVEALKTADPAVAAAIEKHAGTLDAAQTSKAKAIVDAAQGNAPSWLSAVLGLARGDWRTLLNKII